MKKRPRLFHVFLAIVMAFSIIIASPPDVKADSFESYDYTVNDSTITIQAYTGNDTDLVVPSEIDSKTVTGIDELAFAELSITSITIPTGITEIGESAFHNCPKLKDVYYAGSKEDWDLINIASDNDSLINAKKHFDYEYTYKTIINDGVSSIEIVSYTGKNKDVTIPLTIGSLPVTSIGARAFMNCSTVKNVTIPYGITRIGAEAFNLCSALETVFVPGSVTTMDYSVFAQCGKLTHVTLQGGITQIPKTAFLSCTGLSDITLPRTITQIGDNAFQYCSSLTQVTLPRNVSLGSYVFSQCTGLTSATLPEGITSIPMCTFDGCTGLKQITCSKDLTSINQYAFNGHNRCNPCKEKQRGPDLSEDKKRIFRRTLHCQKKWQDYPEEGDATGNL